MAELPGRAKAKDEELASRITSAKLIGLGTVMMGVAVAVAVPVWQVYPHRFSQKAGFWAALAVFAVGTLIMAWGIARRDPDPPAPIIPHTGEHPVQAQSDGDPHVRGAEEEAPGRRAVIDDLIAAGESSLEALDDPGDMGAAKLVAQEQLTRACAACRRSGDAKLADLADRLRSAARKGNRADLQSIVAQLRQA